MPSPREETGFSLVRRVHVHHRHIKDDGSETATEAKTAMDIYADLDANGKKEFLTNFIGNGRGKGPGSLKFMYSYTRSATRTQTQKEEFVTNMLNRLVIVSHMCV